MTQAANPFLFLALIGCSTALDPKPRAMPFCPTETEFQDMRARLACRWSAQCGLQESEDNDPTTCIKATRTDTPYDALRWRECGATYDPCRAGECLAIWRENPVDCGVSFYSGCEWGDWYAGSEGCDVWGNQ